MSRPFLAEWRNALLDSEADRAAVLVGLVLSTFANAGGGCHPGKARLALDSRLSKRAVDGAVERLAASGFLTVSRSRGRSTNGYQLGIPTVQVAALLPTSNGAASDTQRCSQRHPTVQVAAPKSAESAERGTAGGESLDAPSTAACPECEVSAAYGHADWCSLAVRS
jgi:hypothetical protein